MSILLLCTGDEQAKDLLRQSIAVHYGNNPIAFDALKFGTTGHVMQRIGPIQLWLSLKLDTSFQFPTQFRQDYELRLLKIPIRRQSEAFNGETYYLKTGKKPATHSRDTELLHTVQQRLWAFAAMMLMPMNEMYVDLDYIHETCIIARNAETETSARITFYDNYQLKQVVTTSPYNTEKFRIELSEETDVIDERKVYRHLIVSWNNQAKYTLSTSFINFEEDIDSATFQLE